MLVEHIDLKIESIFRKGVRESIRPLDKDNRSGFQNLFKADIEQFIFILDAIGIEMENSWLGFISMEQDIGWASHLERISADRFDKGANELRFACAERSIETEDAGALATLAKTRAKTWSESKFSIKTSIEER